ncbi:MAG: DUF3795 domain-containing protein [Candidatus Stahlbacteria bacterium]|nr:DUF3795 domain-containing protein [Candidatus Stahlbacteria bacterium]
MGKMIGVCGIVCTECPAFLATQKDDNDERKKIAEMWSNQYNTNLLPEHINCDGCLSESKRLLCHCKVCEVRKCGQEKGLKNCAYCNEYACEKLNKFFGMAPEAKAALEKIRESL